MASIVDGNTILSTWGNNNSNWVLDSSGNIKMKSNLESYNYIVTPEKNTNVKFTGTFSMPDDNDGIGFIYDYQDDLNYKMLIYQGGGLSFGSMPDSIRVFHIINGQRFVYLSNNENPYWVSGNPVKIFIEIFEKEIVVFLNDSLALRYNEENFHYGKFGLVTYSQVATISNIEYIETPSNTFFGKYKLYAVDESVIQTEIQVAIRDYDVTFAEITPIVKGQSLKNTELNVMYRGNSDIGVELQPYIFEELNVELEVRPHNTMWALWEVTQPPLIHDISNPTIDSFIRTESAYSTINYGNSLSTVVGRLDGNLWETYMKFDVSHLEPSLFITESKIRLYYAGSSKQLSIEVHDLVDYWEEYSITSLNKPQHNNLIADSYTVSADGKYIDIDVSDKILEWITNPHLNQGVKIGLSENSLDGQMIFRTRESLFGAPELIVTHYDRTIFSSGRSEIITLINVMKADESDKNAEIEVTNAFDFTFLDAEIYVHRVEVPLDSDVLTEITSTKPYEFAEITSAIRLDDVIEAELSVISGINESKIDLDLIVSTPLIYTEINSVYRRNSDFTTEVSVLRDKVYVEITPRVVGVSDVLTEIESVVRLSGYDDTFTEIEVRRTTDSITNAEFIISQPLVPVEFYVRVKDRHQVYTVIDVSNPSIPVEFIISQPLVPVEFYVRVKDENEVGIVFDVSNPILPVEFIISQPLVPVEFYVRVKDRHQVYTVIDVSNPSIPVEINVRPIVNDDVDVELDVLCLSKIDTEITVSNTIVHSEIKVRAIGISSLDAEVFVRYNDDKYSELTARSVSQTYAELDVRAISVINIEVSVSRPDIITTIYPRVKGEHSVEVSIEPRIFMVNNVDTIIVVGSKQRAYGFVM